MPYLIHPKSEPVSTDPFDRYSEDPRCGYPRYNGRRDAYRYVQCYGSDETHAITYVPTVQDIEALRERVKAADWLKTPWHDRQLPEIADVHCVHCDTVQIGKILYAADLEAAIADKFTRISPGRYLERYYRDTFTKREIADYIAQLQAMLSTFGIARTVEEVRQVYRNGPASCMGGPVEHTNRYWHEKHLDGHMPAEVYADSDVAVAYFGPIEKPSQRTLIWPDKKLYTLATQDANKARIYGTGPLQQLLDAAGYRPGSFAGARIRKVTLSNGRILMPYLDGADGAEVITDSDGKEWLELRGRDDCYTLAGNETDGSVRPFSPDDDSDDSDNYRDCDNCGESYDYTNEGSDDLCQNCYDARWSCDECGDVSYDSDNQHWLSRSERTLCESCYDSEHSTCQCDGCNERWIESELPRDDRTHRQRHGLTDYCPDCASEFAWCDACDSSYDTRDSAVCPDCERESRPDDNGDLFADEETESDVSPF